jgi:hypothetical protein
MKYLCLLFLSFFILFLSTPTLIGMLDKKVDTSCFFSLVEEEEENENRVSFEELKTLQSNQFFLENFQFEENNNYGFSSKNDVSSFNLAHQIFSPPPNLI